MHDHFRVVLLSCFGNCPISRFPYRFHRKKDWLRYQGWCRIFFMSATTHNLWIINNRVKTSEQGKIGGLTFLFLFTALIGLSIRLMSPLEMEHQVTNINNYFSIQMCFQENLTNAIFYVILYHFMRDFFFVSRSIVSF